MRHRDRARLGVFLWGGVVGPPAFVGAWVVAGVTTSGYSAVDDAISDLAATDAPTRILMTTGFVVFGLGLVAFGVALRDLVDGRAGIAAITTGACTLGVAATPLGGWAGDAVHAVFAGLGYVSLVALPLLAGPRLRRRGWSAWPALSVLTATACGAFLVASTFGPAHGLWQRLGLTAGDLWIVLTAARLLAEADRRAPSRREFSI